MSEALVETRQLTRRYGSLIALNDLSLSIPAGAIYGLIGPNGAGKTTTMRILTTLLLPSGGEAWVAGHSVLRAPEAVRRMVGFMPDYFGVYDNMKVWEYLEFFAGAYRVPHARRKSMITELLELVDLSHKHEADVMGLSRGMKQRLSLARTLVHDPALLILDEPASGLDPRARIELRELLRELRRLGKTIMISSHILAELAEMCTHIAIIERGQLLAAGDVATMMRSLQPHRSFEIHILEGLAQAEVLLRARSDVLQVHSPGVVPAAEGEDGTAEQQPAVPIQTVAEQPGILQIDFTGDERAQADLIVELVRAGVLLSSFAEQHNDLEDVFLRVTDQNVPI